MPFAHVLPYFFNFHPYSLPWLNLFKVSNGIQINKWLKLLDSLLKTVTQGSLANLIHNANIPGKKQRSFYQKPNVVLSKT